VTPGQLVKAVAIALDVPEETVAQHDRNLVVAGLRTKGGRGRSAPSVTPRDVARLVSAVLGAVKVKDSASVVRFLEATRVSPGSQEYLPLPFARCDELPPDHSFVDALTAILEEMDTSQMFEDFREYARRFEWIAVDVAGRQGSIVYGGPPLDDEPLILPKVILYVQPHSEKKETRRLSDWERELNRLGFRGIEHQAKIRGNCLMMLARSFRQDAPSSAKAVFRAWSAALKKARS
jgi:hypothetical protein